jgi:hypothetical protein
VQSGEDDFRVNNGRAEFITTDHRYLSVSANIERSTKHFCNDNRYEMPELFIPLHPKYIYFNFRY